MVSFVEGGNWVFFLFLGCGWIDVDYSSAWWPIWFFSLYLSFFSFCLNQALGHALHIWTHKQTLISSHLFPYKSLLTTVAPVSDSISRFLSNLSLFPATISSSLDIHIHIHRPTYSLSYYLLLGTHFLPRTHSKSSFATFLLFQYWPSLLLSAFQPNFV